MSVFEELKQLDQRRKELLEGAKKEALDKAYDAVRQLKELGYNYKLVEADDTSPTTGTRRTGVRQQVLTTIKQHPNGITRSDLMDAMQAKGDKRAEQSISNAVAALKKNGDITTEDGFYRAAS